MPKPCTICGEPIPDDVPFKFHGWDGNDCPKPPMHTNLVVLQSGIRHRRDGSFCVFVGEQEIDCASRQEADAMLDDFRSMLAQLGGSIHPPHVQ